MVLFSPPRMKRALLPLRVYVSLFHWHWFLCHLAQLISKAWNLSLLYTWPPEFIFYTSSQAELLFFEKQRIVPVQPSCSQPISGWHRHPRVLHSGSALARTVIPDSPVSQEPPSPVAWKGHNWIRQELEQWASNIFRALHLWKSLARHWYGHFQMFTEGLSIKEMRKQNENLSQTFAH